MSKFLFCAALVLLAASLASGVEVAGILETGAYVTRIDSVVWYLPGGSEPVREPTPGWGGRAQMTDTHQFRPLAAWPEMAELQYNVGGTSLSYTIDAPEPNVWYELPRTDDDQESRVMFKDSLLLGLAGQSRRPLVGSVIEAEPNPFSSQTSLRIASRLTGPVTVRIADASGRVVWSGRVNGALLIDTRHF
ncbi:MAG: hypothetical protein ABIK86_01595, partial [candidate division WOR-3 bacterium]